ncbi:MAG TPA: alpha/beta hydrolase [Myxococcota bacterium]|nr:alpha/beta hydrolase [Myxococcota bacterium]
MGRGAEIGATRGTLRLGSAPRARGEPLLDDVLASSDLLQGVARSRLSLASGIEIALLDFGGTGPLALLHHANGFCAGVWGLVAELLRPRFHVIAMDARGHGDSSKPESRDAYRWRCFAEDLEAVAERLREAHGVDRIGLGLGHSFGGTATLVAAAVRPSLFERIVLVDPVIPPPPDLPVPTERAERVARLASAARERQAVRASRAEAIAAWRERRFFADWDPRALALYAAEGLRDRPDGRVELKCPGEIEATIFEENGTLDVFAHARRVAVPALFLWARRGDFPRPLYEAVAETMPDARVEDVDAGHLAVMERPDLVADAALRFTASGR